jgi:hypothetical protein
MCDGTRRGLAGLGAGWYSAPWSLGRCAAVPSKRGRAEQRPTKSKQSRAQRVEAGRRWIFLPWALFSSWGHLLFQHFELM